MTLIEFKFDIEINCDNLMKWLEVESVINDMISVYQNLKDKEQVFKELKEKYLVELENIKAKARKVVEICAQLRIEMTELLKEKVEKTLDEQRLTVNFLIKN